jgi:hypothetical protein
MTRRIDVPKHRKCQCSECEPSGSLFNYLTTFETGWRVAVGFGVHAGRKSLVVTVTGRGVPTRRIPKTWQGYPVVLERWKKSHGLSFMFRHAHDVMLLTKQ